MAFNFNPFTGALDIVGATGPAGPPGSGDPSFIFTQSTPSTTWTINHNLGYKPSVELFDTGSQEIDAEVVHTNNNQVIAYFNPATAGTARLN